MKEANKKGGAVLHRPPILSISKITGIDRSVLCPLPPCQSEVSPQIVTNASAYIKLGHELLCLGHSESLPQEYVFLYGMGGRQGKAAGRH